MTYNGSLYTLTSVQFTAPSHTSWLTPKTLDVTKVDNKEDIMITFQRDLYAAESASDPKAIILVNPVLRNGSHNGNPLYLTNMANGTAAPVTLESIFPYVSTNTYVYYTTCVNGLTAQDPYKNILVLLNADGMIVSDSLMAQIQTMYNKFSTGAYPAYVPPGNFNTHSNPKESILALKEGFQTAAVYNPGAANPSPSASSSPTSRYTVEKCVPLDPETQVDADGVITMTGAKGQTIHTVNNTRAVVKADWLGSLNHTGYMTITQVEQYFIYAIVGVIGIGIIFGGISLISGIRSLSDFALEITGTGFVACGCFMAGFLIGIFTFPASCSSSPTTPLNQAGVGAVAGAVAWVVGACFVIALAKGFLMKTATPTLGGTAPT